jgi:hypothetical protein
MFLALGSSQCAEALAVRGFRAADSTLAWCGWLSSRALAKTSYSAFNFTDTQGRGAHGPESAAFERLLSITSNYITVRLVAVTSFRNSNVQTGMSMDLRSGSRDG